jgi:hypothetical protein
VATGSVLDSYVRTSPTAENAVKIFDGLWASKLPPPCADVHAGNALTFEDQRLVWALEELGNVRGMRVLELGPLEGGHSYMLDRAGVSQVLAIEGNSGAYLRCLVSKELLGMPAVRFVCGDFIEYLRGVPEQFDLCVASGVLYHMQQPVELVARIAEVAPRVLIWTHYYDEAILRRTRPTVVASADPKPAEYAGFKHRVFRYEYGAALTFSGFCGGNQPFAHWLTRDDIVAALRHFGFSTIVIGPEQPEHPNGPALTLLATKKSEGA